LLQTLCLIGLFALTFSCEKESLLQSEADSPASETVVLEAVPDDVTLADIEVTLADGMLSFATVQDYRVAKKAIALASKADYLAWQSALGFGSQYARYSELMEEAEASDTPFSHSELTPSDEKALSVDKEYGLKLNFPDFVMAKLLDMDGRIIIENDLHQYTADHHIVVDGVDFDKLKLAMANKTSDLSRGFLVQPVTIVDGGSQDDLNDLEKVQIAGLPCPFGVNAEGFFLLSRTDEQHVNGRRYQLRTTFVMANDVLILNNSSGQVVVDHTMKIDYDNRRRKGFNWNSAFPDVAGNYLQDREPDNTSSTEDDLSVSHFLQVRTNSELSFPISRGGQVSAHPGLTDGMGITIPGSQGNQGTIVYDELAMGTTVSGQIQEIISTYEIFDGTAAIRWPNWGDDFTNDPVSVEFACQ
jgi:hypothetical protein